MRLNFDAEEIRDLANQLDRHAVRTPSEAKGVAWSGARLGLEISITRSPVRTGNLRLGNPAVADGVGHTMDAYLAGETRAVGEFGPTASYAPYVERGTSRMAPRPYVSQALDAVEPLFLEQSSHLLDPFQAG